MTSYLDWDKVDQMLMSGCPGTEVAEYFGIHPNTLYRKIEEEKNIKYGEYLQQKRSKGNALIRCQQFSKALGKANDGDTTLLIWLGKCRLQQREHADIVPTNDKDLSIAIQNIHSIDVEGMKKTIDDLQRKLNEFEPKASPIDPTIEEAIQHLGGAVRSGKTFASIFRLIDLLKNGPDGNVMIIGVNRDTIQRNVLLELYKFLGFPVPGTKTTETKLYGRNIYFVGAHDESAVRRIQGSTLALAYVDEATCIPQPFWRMLISRLSVTGAQLLATCNPEAPAHWLKKEFIDRSDELDLIYWNFTLADNPSLDPKYVENLKKEYSGAWYQRLILGEWAVASGLIYDCFDHDNMFEHPKEPPNYYIVGIDYGTTNATAAVLCGIRPNRWPQITVEEEFYYDSMKAGRAKADDELAEDIKRFIGWRNVSCVYVDPAAASFKVALRQLNIPVIDANNDVINGIKTVHRFISNKNIVIHKSCKTLIEHMQSYSWDTKAADRGEDKPVKVNDHILDALRYACYTAFPQGEFSNPDENLTIEQLRRKVYGSNELGLFDQGNCGYM